ncbi:MAG: hypothetical protein JSW68_03850 [Burkholderiales bacterium]|nr:MAG: hypothetical protein JSW68_03850 [Burkholderiales bacterium]
MLDSLQNTFGSAMAAAQRALAPVVQFAVENPAVFVVGMGLVVGWALFRSR